MIYLGQKGNNRDELREVNIMDLEGRLRHHIFNIISKEIASLSVKENLSNK